MPTLKKTKNKSFIKTLKEVVPERLVQLKDKPSDITCHRAIPVLSDEPTDRPSRVQCPESGRMPICPVPAQVPKIEYPEVQNILALGCTSGYDKALVELAKVVGPTPEALDKAHKAKKRHDVLEKLDNILSGRRSNHGAPEDNFSKVAEAWNMWMAWKTDKTITPHDVLIMMSLLKLARDAGGHAEDNTLDAAGYLVIATEKGMK